VTAEDKRLRERAPVRSGKTATQRKHTRSTRLWLSAFGWKT